jgi:zinc protease
MKFSNLNNSYLVKLFFKVIVFIALFFNVNAAEIDLTKVVSLDPMITHGKLDNGVTYYVKKNQLPKNKAYLELVIKTGSLHENNEQLGLAHLLEHMAFNGSKSFPKNKIDEYLRSLGLSLGADFNATTSYERTIYKFQIPTNDEKYLDTGIHILSEISSELALEDEAFERERKIVEEEWRRGLGKFSRIDELQRPYLFKNSKYLERVPIGTMDVIRNFKYETAKEYYRQWYRPELMGVFVVGDIDQKKAEKIIKKYFSSIKAKTPAIEKPLGSVPKYNETIFANITDPEISGLYIQILNREPKLFMETGVNYKDYLIRSLTESIFQRRLSRILIEQDSPLISSIVDVSELSEQEEIYSVVAMFKEGQVDEGLKFLLTEIERVKQNGFVEDELELVKKDKLLSLEISLTQKNTKQSADLLDEYKRHFIDKEMASGIDYEFELAKQVMKTITLKEINDNFYKYYQPDDRVILFKTPEKYKDLLTKEKFVNIEKELSKKKLAQTGYTISKKKLINKELKGSKIVKEFKHKGTDVVELDLENGVKVLLKPTKNKEKEFNFAAKSPGGFSYVSIPALYSIQNTEKIIAESGLGQFTRTELNDLVNPGFVSIAPYFTYSYEGLSGKTITTYQKELFELIYLHFENINYNNTAIDKLKTELKEYLKLTNADAKARFSRKFSENYYKNNPRALSLTEEQIDKINIEDIKKFYAERFKDGSDFTFTFVGDFKVDELKPLITKYLGSLPNLGRKETYVDDGVRVEKELVKYEVFENLEAQSKSIRAYNKNFDYNVKNRFIIFCTDEILKRMLNEEIREKQNLVYSISVQSYGISKFPEQKYSIIIMFDSDPNNKDKIFRESEKVIERLKAGDFPDHYLDESIKAHLRKYELDKQSNRWWTSAISDYYQEKEPLEIAETLDKVIKSITKEDIKKLAINTFDNKYIEASLMPKKQ